MHVRLASTQSSSAVEQELYLSCVVMTAEWSLSYSRTFYTVICHLTNVLKPILYLLFATSGKIGQADVKVAIG